MEYIKFAFLSIRKSAAAFVLVILELAALFLVVNFSVSSINDRKMLNDPFKKILNDKTAFVYDIKYPNNAMEFGLNMRESRQKILDEIQGEYKIYDSMLCVNSQYTVISVSDEIYSRLKLPLTLGSRKTAVATAGTPLGEHVVNTMDGSFTINVSGTLTESTFLPMMSEFSASSLTTKDLFSATTGTPNIIITSRSEIADSVDLFNVNPGFFITLENPADFQNLEKVAGIISSANIVKNSNAALMDDIAGFLPVLLCVLFIVIIGTVSISVIISRQNEYSNGVMWLCGYSKSRIILSHAVNILIVIAISVIVAIAALFTMKITKNELAVTMNLSLANLITSVILSAFLLLISLVFPMVKSAKTSPIEYLGRAK